MSYPGTSGVKIGDAHFPLYINAGDNLDGRAVSVIGIRPDGTEFGGTCGIGTGDIFLHDQSMLSRQWAIYIVQIGDLTQPGIYTMELVVDPPPPALQIPQAIFTVDA